MTSFSDRDEIVRFVNGMATVLDDHARSIENLYYSLKAMAVVICILVGVLVCLVAWK